MSETNENEHDGEGMHALPIVIAVPDCDHEHVVLSVGPLDISDFDKVAAVLGSEEFQEHVREHIREAKEQIEAAKLAAKAQLN